jgi:oligoendopeptidase F
MAQKNITTIEGLAEMLQRTMARKEDVQVLDKKVQALDTKVTAGFERIEHLLLEEQRRKIENLETRMKKLEDALAISPHSKGRQTIAERF